MLARKLTILLILLISSQFIAHAHPADGYPPAYVPPTNTEVVTSDLVGEYGDLTFGSCQLTVDDLTPAELYIVFGACGSSYGTGNQLLPWYHDVFMMANAIKSHTGELPSALSAESINQTVVGNSNNSRLEHFKSPITGDFPRLDDVNFSPGQVYLRELTEPEMRQFASLSPEYQELWFDGVVTDPDTGEILEYLEPVCKVYYIRVYGEREVLVETFKSLHFPR
jgi:hypothetical protein